MSYKVRKLIQLAKCHGTTSCHRKHILSSEYLLSSGASLIIEKTSRHREYFSSSGVPLIIGKTSRHREYLLSLEVFLITGNTSRHREYLLSSEGLLLVAPLVVDSHFCQTGSATRRSSEPRVDCSNLCKCLK